MNGPFLVIFRGLLKTDGFSKHAPSAPLVIRTALDTVHSIRSYCVLLVHYNVIILQFPVRIRNIKTVTTTALMTAGLPMSQPQILTLFRPQSLFAQLFGIPWPLSSTEDGDFDSRLGYECCCMPGST